MSEQVIQSTHSPMQNENSPVSQPELSPVSPGEVRIRTVYAGLCCVLAALLVSLLTYLFVSDILVNTAYMPPSTFFWGVGVTVIDLVVTAVLVPCACLVTVAYYLIQTRHTIANKGDLFGHLRKLLPHIILISIFIYVLIRASLSLYELFPVNWVFLRHLLWSFAMPIAAIVGSLIGLFFSCKKTRFLARQIPAVSSKKLVGLLFLLLALSACATALISEHQSQNYKNSELWTFIPAPPAPASSSSFYLVNPAGNIWYLDENYHIAYYDPERKSKTFISQTAYDDKAYRIWESADVYGDYFIFRSATSSEVAGKKAEYITLNNKKASAVQAVVPQPSQVYDRNGNRYTILPSDSYVLGFSNSYKRGKNKDTILADIPISINQRGDYSQYIEIDLASGKVVELKEQDYNDAQFNIERYHSEDRYRKSYINNKYYIINKETGAKIRQPSRDRYCTINREEKYLICDTEHLQWWTDKSKKGFVYWSLADLMK